MPFSSQRQELFRAVRAAHNGYATICQKKPVAVARYSGWVARIVIVVALILVVLAGLTGRMDDPPVPLDDPAIRNLIMLISGVGAGVTA
jgi:hypothetical protein